MHIDDELSDTLERLRMHPLEHMGSGHWGEGIGAENLYRNRSSQMDTQSTTRDYQ